MPIWRNFQLRAELLRRLRSFFDERGFLEVETPLLSRDVVVDRYIEPLSVTVFEDPQQPDDGAVMWLQTSPEFCMKRLLAKGACEDPPAAPAIYQVTRAFRAAERGPLHHREFTLVEWYCVGDGMNEAMDLLSQLCQTLLDRGPALRVRYADAFVQYAGVDPHMSSIEELAQVELSSLPNRPGQMDRDQWLNLILAEKVEPHLGVEQPVILYDYPAGAAALAQIRPGAPPVAERFELYVQGIELANGYHELLDPAVLRRRNAQVNDQRAADGKRRLPEESQLLQAMESGLPPCAGVALGFDRLAMLAIGASSIDEVITYRED